MMFRSLLRFAFVLLLLSSYALPQGFGISKKEIALKRKLPAAIEVGSVSSMKVQSKAQSPQNAEVATSLETALQTELLKHNKAWRIDDHPDLAIACTILSYDAPPPTIVTRQDYVGKKTQPHNYKEVTGTLNVAYQVTEKNGQVVDADNVTSKFEEEFDTATNTTTSNPLTKLDNPFKHNPFGKKTAEQQHTETPPDAVALRQKLVSRIVSQIAARLVTTDESLNVYLARGKLDDANKQADAGRWTQYLQALDTMTPLPSPNDDAYRVYNMGVAYEALAYQAPDAKTAKKYLEEASVQYDKAIEANKQERYFIEPQTRIETALAHYKKLSQGSTAVAASASKPPAAASMNPGIAENVGGAKPAAASGVSASTTGATATPATHKSLSNQQVIDMFKAGVDEQNIIATIRSAHAVDFDLSPDGQIDLAKNGVKGAIVTAMRAKVQKRSAPVAPGK